MNKTPPKVKICGIKSIEALKACIEAEVDFCGFVFYPKSPRHLSEDIARMLLAATPSSIKRVGLYVDPVDSDLNCADQLDFIQLHGEETPERCAEIKQQTGRPIIKAIAIADKTDMAQIKPYEDICDWLLFDAKPVSHNEQLPGGNGLRFDWRIIQEHVTRNGAFKTNWMLAGGLDQGNVAEAISLLSPDAVDISSGVELRPGQKDPLKIKNFIAAARGID